MTEEHKRNIQKIIDLVRQVASESPEAIQVAHGGLKVNTPLGIVECTQLNLRLNGVFITGVLAAPDLVPKLEEMCEEIKEIWLEYQIDVAERRGEQAQRELDEIWEK